MAASKPLVTLLDETLANTKPSKIVFTTLGATAAAVLIYKALAPGDVAPRAYKLVWRQIRKVAASVVNKEIDAAAKGITFKHVKGEQYITEMPEEALSEDEVVSMSDKLHEQLDDKMDKSLLSGVVYWGTKNHHKTLMRILDTHLWSNPLFADYFGATRKMEAEIVQWGLKLFNASYAEDACATYALGGSESCILATLAYRNQGLANGITEPEIIIPSSTHPAFHKAAEYFRMKVITVHPDPVTQKLPVDEVEKSITANTVAIIGNSPNFAFGVVDDLKALSDLALKYNIGLHSDACLGGWLIQFMGDAGFEQPVIDFRLPGVTSISADIHKWGGAPKGASLIMFRTKELRKHSTFAFANYPGGLYVTSGISGSRPGFVIACAWATILRTGRKGYVANCKTVVTVSREVARQIQEIPELRLIGKLDEIISVVPFTSDRIDIYVAMKRMRDLGWVFNALQFPASVHLGVTMEHAQPGVVDRMMADLRKTVADLVAETTGDVKNLKHDALIYGSTQGVADRTIIQDVLRKYVDKYYENDPEEAEQ